MESLFDTSVEATDIFHTFTAGEPDLVRTGLGLVDRSVGGLFPGSSLILGAATGVGKTSLVLHSAFNACKHHPVLILSLEDGPDVLGSRALAELSGVDSLKIRRKMLTPEEKKRVSQAQDDLNKIPVFVDYPRNPSDIEAACKDAAKEGVRMVYVDYIQKHRTGSDQRRNEVGVFFTACQQAAKAQGQATFFTSQFPRKDPKEKPQLSWFKESGDLENEARVCVLCMRLEEPGRPQHSWPVTGWIAKSSFGGEGVRATWRRDPSGVLREVDDRYEDF